MNDRGPTGKCSGGAGGSGDDGGGNGGGGDGDDVGGGGGLAHGVCFVNGAGCATLPHKSMLCVMPWAC